MSSENRGWCPDHEIEFLDYCPICHHQMVIEHKNTNKISVSFEAADLKIFQLENEINERKKLSIQQEAQIISLKSEIRDYRSFLILQMEITKEEQKKQLVKSFLDLLEKYPHGDYINPERIDT